MNRIIQPLPLILFALLLTGGAIQAQDTQENSEFKLAVGLYNDGLFELAEDQFTVFIQKFPTTALGAEARFYLGLIQLKSKNYGAARNTFQEFALRYSDNPKAADAWWHVGESFEAMRHYAEAASAYSRIKTFYPRSGKAPLGLVAASRNFLKAGDIGNAKLSLNAIVIEYPQSEAVKEANFTLGEIYMSEGEYRRALNEFQRLSTSPDAPADLKARSIVAAGNVQNLMGERQAAEQAFQQVINSYPKSLAAQEAYLHLGNVQRQQGNCSSAAAHYERVMKDGSADPHIRQQAFQGAAECAVLANEPGRASDIYAELFNTFPAATIDPEMYMLAGRAARTAGKYSQALSYLETLYVDTLLRADKPLVLAELARTAAEGGNYSEAVQRYREYASRYAGSRGAPYALLELATVYEKHFGNASEALKVYGLIVDQYGTSGVADNAQYRRAVLLESEGKYEAAGEAYSQFLAQFPASEMYGEAEARYKNVMRFHAGNPNTALKQVASILGAMQENRSSGDVDYLLGVLYQEHLKMYSDAERHFTAAAQKGLAGEQQERAEYGIALAAARKHQSGKAGKAEAVSALQQYVNRHSSATGMEQAQYELFLVQSEGASPADALEACENYLGSKAGAHRTEVTIARGKALLDLGRSAEAIAAYSTLLSGATTPDVADGYYWRGVAYATNGDLQKAKTDLNEYTRAATSGRYGAHALLELGKLSVQNGEYAQAVQAFESLSRQYRYSNLRYEADIALLDALTRASMPERAEHVARALWQAASDNPFMDAASLSEYLYQYAVVLASVRKQDDAKRVLHDYMARFPSGPRIGDVYFAIGQIYKDEGKINLATQYLQRAGVKGGNTEAGREAADLLLENGHYASAVRQYRQLAESEQTVLGKTYAHSRVVVALYRSDNLSEATQEAERFKSLYPDAETVFDEFFIEEGKYYFRKRQYDKAEDLFDEAEGSDSKDLEAMANFWLGKTLEGRNKNEDAKKKFSSVVSDYSGTEAAMQSMLSLGEMALRAEQYADAALQYKNVVEMEGVPEAQLKDALSGLINCYDFLQYYDAAAEMTKRFIAAYPGDPTAFRKKVNLGQYYYYLSYFDQAITHLESLLGEATADDQAEIRYYIGESYYYKGDYTQAALEFLKVPYLVVRKTEIDWRASAYFMAGQAYEKQAKYGLAKEMYNKILTLKDVDGRFVAQARKEIDRVEKLLQ